MKFFNETRVLELVLERLNKMSAQLDALTAQVAQNVTVEQSAVTLLQGLSAQIQTAVAAAEAGDTTALTTLASDLNTSAAALSAAVVANTPHAPAA